MKDVRLFLDEVFTALYGVDYQLNFPIIENILQKLNRDFPSFSCYISYNDSVRISTRPRQFIITIHSVSGNFLYSYGEILKVNFVTNDLKDKALLCEFVTEGSSLSFIIRNISFIIELAAANRTIPPLNYKGDIIISYDQNIRSQSFQLRPVVGFSIPDISVPGKGIVLSAKNINFDFRNIEDASHNIITADCSVKVVSKDLLPVIVSSNLDLNITDINNKLEIKKDTISIQASSVANVHQFIRLNFLEIRISDWVVSIIIDNNGKAQIPQFSIQGNITFNNDLSSVFNLNLGNEQPLSFKCFYIESDNLNKLVSYVILPQNSSFSFKEPLFNLEISDSEGLMFNFDREPTGMFLLKSNVAEIEIKLFNHPVSTEAEIIWVHGRPSRIQNQIVDHALDKLNLKLKNISLLLPLGSNSNEIEFDLIDIFIFSNNPDRDKRLFCCTLITSWYNISSHIYFENLLRSKLNNILRDTKIKTSFNWDQYGSAEHLYCVIDSETNYGKRIIQQLIGDIPPNLDRLFPEINFLQLHAESYFNYNTTENKIVISEIISQVKFIAQLDLSGTIYSGFISNSRSAIDCTITYSAEQSEIRIDFVNPLSFNLDLPGHPTGDAPLINLTFKSINVTFDTVTYKPKLIKARSKLQINLPPPLNNLFIEEHDTLKFITITLPDFNNADLSISGDFNIDLSHVSPSFYFQGNKLKIINLLIGKKDNVFVLKVQCAFETHVNMTNSFGLNASSGLVIFEIRVDDSVPKYITEFSSVIDDISLKAGMLTASLEQITLNGNINIDNNLLNEFSSGFSARAIILRYGGNDASLPNRGSVNGTIDYQNNIQKISFEIEGGFDLNNIPGIGGNLPEIDVEATYKFIFERRIVANIEYTTLGIEAKNAISTPPSNINLLEILQSGVLPENVKLHLRLEFYHEKIGNYVQNTRALLIYEVELSNLLNPNAIQRLFPNVPLLDLNFSDVIFHAQTELENYKKNGTVLFSTFISSNVGIPKIELPENINNYLEVNLGKPGLRYNNKDYIYFKAKFELSAGANGPKVNLGSKATIEDVGNIGVKFPGLNHDQNALDNIWASLNSASVEADFSSSSTNGLSTTTIGSIIALSGSYHLHLDLTSLPLPEEFKQVFSFAEKFTGDPDLRGKLDATFELDRNAQGEIVWIATGICRLEEFGLAMAIQDLLQFFGTGGIPEGYKPTAEITGDGMLFSCSIDYIKIVLTNKIGGSKITNGIDPPTIRVCATLRFLTATIPLFFELSENVLAMGVDEMPIPLKLTLPPFDPSMFDYRIEDGDIEQWFLQKISNYEADIFINSGNANIKRYLLIQKAIVEVSMQFCLRINDIKGRKRYLEFLKFFAEQYKQLLNFPVNVPSGNSQPTFELKGLPYFSLDPVKLNGLFSATNPEEFLNAIASLISIDETAKLRLGDIRLDLNLEEMRKSGFNGKMKLSDFKQDNLLRILEIIEWQFGLSSDVIHFSLKTPGKVYFPKIGEWEGVDLSEMLVRPGSPALSAEMQLEMDRKGFIRIDKALIGFGYTKRSFACQFEGEIRLPDSLLDVLQKFQEAGTDGLMYILPPRKTSLYFRFELIPVPCGNMVIVIPYFDFNLDLRSEISPGIISTRDCKPYWDGLQVHIQDVFEADIKRIGFSPLSVSNIAPTFPIACDLNIGSKHFGFTAIMDNVTLSNGVFVPAILQFLPYPFIYDPLMPWADNICLQARFAGFGVNMNFQRPFPTVGLDAVMETLAILSDPSFKISPNGSLANCLRIALTDVYLSIPDYARQIFPQLPDKLIKPVDLVLNVATFQHLFAELFTIIGKFKNIIPQAEDWKDGIKPEINLKNYLNKIVGDLSDPSIIIKKARLLLQTIPLQARTFTTRANFGGFECGVFVALISKEEFVTLISKENKTRITLDVDTTDARNVRIGLENFDKDTLAGINPGKAPGFKATFYNPDQEDRSVLLANGLYGFNELNNGEMAQLMPESSEGVMVVAEINVFGLQQLDFYGFIGVNKENPTIWSFSLLSEVISEPLKLTFGQIVVPIPLEIDARLRLSYSADISGIIDNNIGAIINNTQWESAFENIKSVALSGTGFIEADFTADWNVIPGILHVYLGKKAAPFRPGGEVAPNDNLVGEILNGNDREVGVVVTKGSKVSWKNLKFVVDLEPEVNFPPPRDFAEVLNGWLLKDIGPKASLNESLKQQAEDLVESLIINAELTGYNGPESEIVKFDEKSGDFIFTDHQSKRSYIVEGESIATYLTDNLKSIGRNVYDSTTQLGKESIDTIKNINFNNYKTNKVPVREKTILCWDENSALFNFQRSGKTISTYTGVDIAFVLTKVLKTNIQQDLFMLLLRKKVIDVAIKLLAEFDDYAKLNLDQMTIEWDMKKSEFLFIGERWTKPISATSLYKYMNIAFKNDNSLAFTLDGKKSKMLGSIDGGALLGSIVNEQARTSDPPQVTENQTMPCKLILDSNGKFVLSGNGQIRLFEGIDGLNVILNCNSLLILNNYLYASGGFSLQLDTSLITSNIPLLFKQNQISTLAFNITGNGSGEIGPQNHFEFLGTLNSNSRIFGLSVNETASFTISEKILSLKYRINESEFSIYGFDLKVAGDADVEAVVQFINNKVAFSIEGGLTLMVKEIGALNIEPDISILGRCRFACDTKGNVEISTEGTITWNNQTWLGGKVTLSSGKFEIEGSTIIMIDSSSISQILDPFEVESNLVERISKYLPSFNFNIYAKIGFELDPLGRFKSLSLGYHGILDVSIHLPFLESQNFVLFSKSIPSAIYESNVDNHEIPIFDQKFQLSPLKIKLPTPYFTHRSHKIEFLNEVIATVPIPDTISWNSSIPVEIGLPVEPMRPIYLKLVFNYTTGLFKLKLRESLEN